MKITKRKKKSFVAGLYADVVDNGRGNMAFAEKQNGTVCSLEE